MVAYSFAPRFAPLIRRGEKLQTIRAPRKRHAHAGESLQLFTGMRTRHCVKIIPDVVCLKVSPVVILFDARGGIARIEVDHVEIGSRHDFARADGFDDASDMAAFWADSYRASDSFTGVLIQWGGVT